MPQTMEARVEVYDTAGRRVYRSEERTLPPGRRELRWDGLVEGEPLPPGAYFVQVHGPSMREARKVVLIRNRPR